MIRDDAGAVWPPAIELPISLGDDQSRGGRPEQRRRPKPRQRPKPRGRPKPSQRPSYPRITPILPIVIPAVPHTSHSHGLQCSQRPRACGTPVPPSSAPYPFDAPLSSVGSRSICTRPVRASPSGRVFLCLDDFKVLGRRRPTGFAALPERRPACRKFPNMWAELPVSRGRLQKND